MKNIILIIVSVLITTQLFGQVNPAKERVKQTEPYRLTIEDIENLMSFGSKEFNSDSMNTEFFVILNEYRRFKNLPELTFDTLLFKTADIQTQYCTTKKKLSHINSNPSLRHPSDRLKSIDTNYNVTFKGEIILETVHMMAISEGRSIIEHMLDMFYNSPPHKEIMENRESTKVGISIKRNNENKRHYCVVVFGKKS
jgi:uncharacterized protein YkwD